MKLQKFVSNAILFQGVEVSSSKSIKSTLFVRFVLNNLVKFPQIALEIVLVFRVDSINFSIDRIFKHQGANEKLRKSL